MTETPEQRRERLVLCLRECGLQSYLASKCLDALLDALEPPVADMVRRGLNTDTLVRARLRLELHYRPRSEP